MKEVIMNKTFIKVVDRIGFAMALFSIVFSEVRIFSVLFGVSIIIGSILNLITLKRGDSYYIFNICGRILLFVAGVYIIMDTGYFSSLF